MGLLNLRVNTFKTVMDIDKQSSQKVVPVYRPPNSVLEFPMIFFSIQVQEENTSSLPNSLSPLRELMFSCSLSCLSLCRGNLFLLPTLQKHNRNLHQDKVFFATVFLSGEHRSSLDQSELCVPGCDDALHGAGWGWCLQSCSVSVWLFAKNYPIILPLFWDHSSENGTEGYSGSQNERRTCFMLKETEKEDKGIMFAEPLLYATSLAWCFSTLLYLILQ